jgi:hypothetical protein
MEHTKKVSRGVVAWMGKQPSPSIFGISRAEFDTGSARYGQDFRAPAGLSGTAAVRDRAATCSSAQPRLTTSRLFIRTRMACR